jgi:hypothetical protein
MVMTQATTAVANTVPGGSAVGIGMTYGMLGSWGYSRSGTTTAVLVSGVWNSFVKLGLPVLALVLVLLQGGAGGGRVTAALLGIAGLVGAIVVVALMLRSQEQARQFGLLARRIASRVLRLVGRAPVAGWELATQILGLQGLSSERLTSPLTVGVDLGKRWSAQRWAATYSHGGSQSSPPPPSRDGWRDCWQLWGSTKCGGDSCCKLDTSLRQPSLPV